MDVLNTWLETVKSAHILRRIRKTITFYNGRAMELRLLEIDAIMLNIDIETRCLEWPIPVAVNDVQNKYFTETKYNEEWYSFFNRSLSRDDIKILRDLYWVFRLFEEKEMHDSCQQLLNIAANPLIEVNYDHSLCRTRADVMNYVFKNSQSCSEN